MAAALKRVPASLAVLLLHQEADASGDERLRIRPATLRKWVERGHITRGDGGYDLTEILGYLEQRERSTSVDLYTWLKAQLDDDERLARGAADSMLWHGPVKAGEIWESDKGFVYTEGQVPGLRDECLWKADTPGRYTREMSELVAHHVARHDPARVLREVEAKRQIVEVHQPFEVVEDPACQVCADTSDKYSDEWTREEWPCLTLRLLALPYADRQGYREEWRP